MPSGRTKHHKNDEIRIGASTSTAGTEKFTLASPSSATHGQDGIYMRQFSASRHHYIPEKILKNAIYNHLRFLRARGESRVSIEDIARSLNLPVSEVKRIAVDIKGVKVA